MLNFILTVNTRNGVFYGGSIKAASVDDADEAAFIIFNNLKNDGIGDIFGIDVVDYFNFKGNLQLLNNKTLNNYLSYHRLPYDENVDDIFLQKLLNYFEKREEYEKCSVIFKRINAPVLEMVA